MKTRPNIKCQLSGAICFFYSKSSTSIRKRSDILETKELVSDAISILNNLGNTSGIDYVDALHKIAYAKLMDGFLDSCKIDTMLALKLLDKFQEVNSEKIASLYLSISYLLLKTKEHEKAKECIKASNAIYTKLFGKNHNKLPIDEINSFFK